MSAYVAHSDGRDFDGRPSLSGYCGRGSTYNLPGGHDWRTAIAGWHRQKKGLHRPRHSAIVLLVTAAGSHPDCRAILIQIVAL
jgi:hypothetical protein